MSIDTQPRAYALVTGPRATFTAPDGSTEPIAASPDEDIRQVILHRAAAEARRHRTAVELVTTGDRGEHHLLVTPDGSVVAPPATRHRPSAPIHVGEQVSEWAPEPPATPPDDAPEPSPHRASFITTPESADHTRTGWRGFLARIGLTVPPSRAQQQRARDEYAVSQQWAGCRTIAVVNGKGGVGKTMTTAMIAAVFARFGGGTVLAWDNNDTRGTLGWRTEAGRYDSTVRDLLPAARGLLEASSSISDIARFVHHQSVDRYDVLRSNPELLATDQRISRDDFDLLVQATSRYYRIIVFDSGNDESADRWLRVVDGATQLVIPTITTPESAESASLLLDALRQRDERSRTLAENAVVVVTQPEPAGVMVARSYVDAFTDGVRAVESVPFDAALRSGPLRLDDLRRPTRDAWIRVAAAVARGLEES